MNLRLTLAHLHLRAVHNSSQRLDGVLAAVPQVFQLELDARHVAFQLGYVGRMRRFLASQPCLVLRLRFRAQLARLRVSCVHALYSCA